MNVEHPTRAEALLEVLDMVIRGRPSQREPTPIDEDIPPETVMLLAGGDLLLIVQARMTAARRLEEAKARRGGLDIHLLLMHEVLKAAVRAEMSPFLNRAPIVRDRGD